MDKLYNTIVVTAGAIVGYFLGGWDGLLKALIIFIAADYVTGILAAIIKKKLSSEIGFEGICKKIFILIMVGVCNIIDETLIGQPMLRTAVIFFYISNEGISIVENAAVIGLPVPPKVVAILQQLKTKGEDEHEPEDDTCNEQ